MSKVTKSEKIPKAMEPKYQTIVGITDPFCAKHLNDEYAQLIRYAVAALCRKRPSPLSKGRENSWACGVTHAIGMVNFLFDDSQTPHMRASDIYKKFGVSQNTGLAKSKVVRDALDMYQMDPDWCLPSLLDDNLMVWMLSVDGMIVDIRHMPRDTQALAFEQGLIPYIPADQEEHG